jgi:hypothetical protein
MENLQLFTEPFILRLLVNSVSMFILVRLVYYNTYRSKENFFPFFLLNLIVFILAYTLENTGGFDSIGSAFGLLAAFTLLRFRTMAITMKDMTYLFIVMTFGLINSIMKGSFIEIVALNLLIIIVVYIIDGKKTEKKELSQTIDYPSLENIKPEKRAQLIAELTAYTGLNIQRISIEHVDVVKSRILVKVFYKL